MTEELKNCPFCGGKAALKLTDQCHEFSIWVECKCGVRTSQYHPDISDEDTAMSDIEIAKNMAIEAWNRRVNDADRD